MKQLLVINWRWKGFNDNCSQKIELTSRNKSLYISKYDKDNIDNFYKDIKQLIYKEEPNEALILSHNNPTSSDISIPENKITLIQKDNFLMKKREFKGGEEFIYWGNTDPDGMIDTDKKSYSEQLKKENFAAVWDWYWNKLELEYQKKKIINLWLPLAIDIQGIKDDNKKNLDKYFNEIKSDVFEYVNEDYLKSWYELKNSLPQEVWGSPNSDVPSQIVESLKDDKTTAENFYQFYIEKSQGNSFLPDWLQEVVKVLDNIHTANSENSK